jgi:hypothetical protein
MKLKSTGLVILGTVFLCPAANAGTLVDFYAGAMVGAGGATVFSGHDRVSESGQSYGAVLGIDIPLLRLELEYNYLNGADMRMNAGMVNAYFKMPSTVIMPYIGVGMGSVFGGHVKDISIDATAAYQGMLGISFNIPVLPVKFDIEGRALYAPNLFEVADQKPDFLLYDLRLKARYVF